MAGKKSGKGEGTTIVIRREEGGGGGHHGGAWKVAYADFVTAMMAFFLLMWLLNATTEEQRHGIADYFSPSNPLGKVTSGNGQPFGGKTPYDNGAAVSDKGSVQISKAQVMSPDVETDADILAKRQTGLDGDRDGSGLRDDAASGAAQIGQGQLGTASSGMLHAGTSQTVNDLATSGQPGNTPPGSGQPGPDKPGTGQPGTGQPGSGAAMAAQQEQAALHSAADEIRDAVRNDPALAALAPQLSIDETPEGLRIQLLDDDKKAMFAFGSSTPNERARQLLQKVAPVLAHLSEDISLTGHTDAAPFKGADKSNWELSTERANATRRVLVDNGLIDGRFRSVSGDADRDPLLPADPLAAANRRIAIVVLRNHPLPGNQTAPGQATGKSNLGAATPAKESPPASAVVPSRGIF